MPQAASTEFTAPQNLEQLIAALGSAAPGPVRALAGGTDLLVQLRSGAPQPARIVDLKRVPELSGVAIGDDAIRIGAATPAAQIVEHEQLRQLVPGLVEATDLIGSTQIQGRATLGGNLCNASPAADTVPSLIVLAARCRIVGPAGERTLDVSEVVVGPAQTSLARGEIVVSFDIPVPAKRSGDAYLRLIPRSEMDIAVAGAAVSLTLDAAGNCSAARVAIGAVGPTATLVPRAAEALVGTGLDDAALARLAEAASQAARPIDDKRGTVAYRKQVVGVLARRAALRAAERARAGRDQ